MTLLPGSSGITLRDFHVDSSGNLSGELTGTLGIGDFTLAQATVAVSASAADPGVIHLEADGGFDIGFLESDMHGELTLNVLTGEFDYSFSGTAFGISVPGFDLVNVNVVLDNDGFEATALVLGSEVGGVTRAGCLQVVGAEFPLPGGSCAPEFSIGDRSQSEGDPGQSNTQKFFFTVTMSRQLGIFEHGLVTIPITVETDSSVEASRRASVNADFNLLPTPIVVQFSRDDGDLTKTVTVTVYRDLDVEEDERFRVVLGTPSYGVIADGVGIGTIVNDDFPPPDSTMLVGLDGSQQQTFTGPTRGGTISAATVFLDANGNRSRDFLDLNGNGIQDTGEPDEPRSTTNAEGQGSFFVPKQFDRNGDGGVDFTEGTLVSVGGVDLGSLLSQATPFTAPAGSRIITPLTSIGASLFERHGVRPIAAGELILDYFQLPRVQLYGFDHVEETLGGNVDGPLVAAAAVQINSTAIQIARLINGAASVPVDLAALSVFDRIADEILSPASRPGWVTTKQSPG